MERPDYGQWSPFWLSDSQKYNRLNRLRLHDGMRCLCCRLASGFTTFGSGCKEDFEHVFCLISKSVEYVPETVFGNIGEFNLALEIVAQVL